MMRVIQNNVSAAKLLMQGFIIKKYMYIMSHDLIKFLLHTLL